MLSINNSVVNISALTTCHYYYYDYYPSEGWTLVIFWQIKPRL